MGTFHFSIESCLDFYSHQGFFEKHKVPFAPACDAARPLLKSPLCAGLRLRCVGRKPIATPNLQRIDANVHVCIDEDTSHYLQMIEGARDGTAHSSL